MPSKDKTEATTERAAGALVSNKFLSASAAKQLDEIIQSVVAEAGLVLVSARIYQQGKRRVLSITIHRKGGKISLDDCENVSRNVEALLDEHAGEPIITGAYALEVESPGIDRPLTTEHELRLFQGESIEVSVRNPIEGLGSSFTGQLASVEESKVTIKNPKPLKASKNKEQANAGSVPEELSVPRNSISSIKLFAGISFGQR